MKLALQRFFFRTPAKVGSNLNNSVDKTKLSCYTLPLTQHHSFFRNSLPLIIKPSWRTPSLLSCVEELTPVTLGRKVTWICRKLNDFGKTWRNHLVLFFFFNQNKRLLTSPQCFFSETSLKNTSCLNLSLLEIKMSFLTFKWHGNELVEEVRVASWKFRITHSFRGKIKSF